MSPSPVRSRLSKNYCFSFPASGGRLQGRVLFYFDGIVRFLFLLRIATLQSLVCELIRTE